MGPGFRMILVVIFFGWCIVQLSNIHDAAIAGAMRAGRSRATADTAAASLPDAAETNVIATTARANDQAADTATETPEQSPEAAALDAITLKVSWDVDGFGTIILMTPTIKNGYTAAIHDISVSCNFMGGSGTVIDTKSITLYDTIPAKKTRTLGEVNMGFVDQQTRRIGCWVTGLEL